MQPFAVHATYSLDQHDDVAKTQARSPVILPSGYVYLEGRFRENGLWRVDQPEYFSGKYLALHHSMSPEVAATLARYKLGKGDGNIAVRQPPPLSNNAPIVDVPLPAA
ncbi:MAG: hypothetical protein SGPRY_004342 [Prymnesium sp.]